MPIFFFLFSEGILGNDMVGNSIAFCQTKNDAVKKQGIFCGITEIVLTSFDIL